jgi:hypothetical protein
MLTEVYPFTIIKVLMVKQAVNPRNIAEILNYWLPVSRPPQYHKLTNPTTMLSIHLPLLKVKPLKISILIMWSK